MRINEHPVIGELDATEPIAFEFNGVPFEARPGEPVGAALLAQGVRALRKSPVDREQRGLYCGIGHCYECRIWVNNESQVRACITPVEAGAEYTSERVGDDDA